MKKLDQLTGWRFVAAFGVILCHLRDMLFPGEPRHVDTIFAAMANFVGFFFVLSGFILAYNYQDRLNSGKTTRWAFLVARFARIYPAFIFSLIVALPAFLFLNLRLHSPTSAVTTHALASIFMVKTWFPFVRWDTIIAWNGPTWSIETEFFFYLVFPFLIKPLAKLNLKSNTMLWIAIVVVLTAVCKGYDVWSQRVEREPFLGCFELLHSSPYFCILEFAIGIVTYNICRQLPEASAEKIRSISGPMVGIFFVAYLLMNATLGVMSVFHGMPTIIFSLVILASGLSPHVLRGLGSSTMVYLGEISYSLYLLHIPVRRIFEFLAKAIRPLGWVSQHASPIYALIIIFFSIGLASFCMKYIEEPCRLRIRKALS